VKVELWGAGRRAPRRCLFFPPHPHPPTPPPHPHPPHPHHPEPPPPPTRPPPPPGRRSAKTPPLPSPPPAQLSDFCTGFLWGTPMFFLFSLLFSPTSGYLAVCFSCLSQNYFFIPFLLYFLPSFFSFEPPQLADQRPNAFAVGIPGGRLRRVASQGEKPAASVIRLCLMQGFRMIANISILSLVVRSRRCGGPPSSRSASLLLLSLPAPPRTAGRSCSPRPPSFRLCAALAPLRVCPPDGGQGGPAQPSWAWTGHGTAGAKRGAAPHREAPLFLFNPPPLLLTRPTRRGRRPPRKRRRGTSGRSRPGGARCRSLRFSFSPLRAPRLPSPPCQHRDTV